MKTITKKYKVYTFNELSEDSQQKALGKLWDINVDYDWWESTYDDAKEIDLKITGFDIDRGAYCKGNFIDSAENTAHKIIDNHGPECETYKDSETYLKDRDSIINNAERDQDGEFINEYELDNKLDDLDSEYLKTILEDYRIILQKEYEYQTGRDAIIETINANEYTFLADGTMFNG